MSLDIPQLAKMLTNLVPLTGTNLNTGLQYINDQFVFMQNQPHNFIKLLEYIFTNYAYLGPSNESIKNINIRTFSPFINFIRSLSPNEKKPTINSAGVATYKNDYDTIQLNKEPIKDIRIHLIGIFFMLNNSYSVSDLLCHHILPNIIIRHECVGVLRKYSLIDENNNWKGKNNCKTLLTKYRFSEHNGSAVMAQSNTSQSSGSAHVSDSSIDTNIANETSQKKVVRPRPVKQTFESLKTEISTSSQESQEPSIQKPKISLEERLINFRNNKSIIEEDDNLDDIKPQGPTRSLIVKETELNGPRYIQTPEEKETEDFPDSEEENNQTSVEHAEEKLDILKMFASFNKDDILSLRHIVMAIKRKNDVVVKHQQIINQIDINNNEIVMLKQKLEKLENENIELENKKISVESELEMLSTVKI